MKQKENEDNKTSWSQHFDQYVVMSPLEGSINLVLSILAGGNIIYNIYKIHNLKTNPLLRSLTIPDTENRETIIKGTKPSQGILRVNQWRMSHTVLPCNNGGQ